MRGSVPSYEAQAEYIAAAAAARGIDPEVALAVAKSEGLQPGTWQSNYSRNGHREPSFGAFQLLDGGPKTGFTKGMGNDFRSQTGLNPRDPANWQAMVDFALNHAAQKGWGAWYGAPKVGVSRWDGLQGAKAVPIGAVQTGPSQALLDFAAQDAQLGPAPADFNVDTSFAGLFGMDSMPGIDGLHSSQMSRDSIPEGKPYDALSEFVSFNEAREGNQATGIGAAFQDALGPSMADFAVVDPFSEIFSGMEAAPAMAAVPADRFDQAFSAFSGPTAAMPADVSISTITPDTAPQSTMTSGVPQGRFDQTFDVFGAPSVAATTAGLPSLDPAQTLESRPEVVGPSMNLDDITATPSAKPGKDEGKGRGGFGKFNPEDPNELGALGKAAFAAGLMSNPAMAIGGLALSNAINGRALNAGMGFGLGNAFGGLGGLGGLFDGSPSVGHAALGFAANNAMNNPNYGTWDFARDFTNMGGMISNGRAAPGMVTAAEFNAGLRDSGLAIGVMEGLSRDFGGLGGLGGSSGSGKGGKGGSGSKGGGNKDEAGMSGADGGM